MEKPKVYSYARFSSAEQGKGYSLERQEKRALEWATKKGLTIEESHSDKGLSGYHGDHLKTGSLGRFLADVDAGRIPPGSFLLVEQFDRLTRQNLDDAQDLIRSILKKGIVIVTLSNGKEYRSGQGLGDAINVLIALEAAHLESSNKADRLRESWKKRLEKAEQGQIICKQCPGWLRVRDNAFELLPDRVAELITMFTLADEGVGVQAIATRLNQKAILSWKFGRKWQKATVYKLLNSKAPLGILERKLTANPGDQPTVKEIPNYYPAIIQPELWHRVQKSLKAKANHPKAWSSRSGRKGHYRNLFFDVAVCGYCGARMTVMDAGTGANGAKFRHWMVCRDARLKLGCHYFSHPYQLIEQAILDYSTEIGFDAILTGGDMVLEITQAREVVKHIRDNIAGKKAQLDAELSLASKATNPTLIELLLQRLELLQGEIDALTVALEDAQHAEERLGRTDITIKGHLEAVKSLREHLYNPDEEKMTEARRLTRLAIKESIDKVTVFPNGLGGRLPVFREGGIIIQDGHSPSLLEEYPDLQDMFKEHVARNTGRLTAAFLIEFRNGHSRLFRWDQEKKGFVQTMVDDGAATLMLFEGEGLVKIDKGPGNFAIPSK